MPRKAKHEPTISSVNIEQEYNGDKPELDNTNEIVKNIDSPQSSAVNSQFEEIHLIMTAFKCSLSNLNSHMKLLEKDIKKELRQMKKSSSKCKEKTPRKPSGFAKPSDVSEELCQFMGKNIGTQIARTEVTQYLIQYIKKNELQFKENKKIIVPDEALKSLLGIDNNTEVTYFNLQGLMNKHFIH